MHNQFTQLLSKLPLKPMERKLLLLRLFFMVAVTGTTIGLLATYIPRATQTQTMYARKSYIILFCFICLFILFFSFLFVCSSEVEPAIKNKTKTKQKQKHKEKAKINMTIDSCTYFFQSFLY